MEFRDGLIQGFTPKFRDFDKDWERYLFALVDLDEEGKLPPRNGGSLYSAFSEPGYSWLTDQYFDAGKLDELEVYHTPSGETSFGPIYDGTLAVLDRFRAMGEAARVRRVWRAHTGLLKSTYWFYISEKKKGFVYNPQLAFEPEAEQRATHEKLVARAEEMKVMLLEIMGAYRDLSRETGATDAEIALIEADMAAIAAEERPRPPGKPDPRKMTEDLFWELIDEGLGEVPLGERLDTLPERLAMFRATAIREFEKILRQMDARAYRMDVWALAYLLQGGCSDDAFEQFRGWLILQGREVFEATLADPDGFEVALHSGQAGGMDALRDAAPMAYEMRQGKAMPPVRMPLLALSGPDIAEEDFAKALPRIASAVEWDG